MVTINLETITTQTEWAKPPFSERNVYVKSWDGWLSDLEAYLAKMDKGGWFLVPGSVSAFMLNDGADGPRPYIILQLWRKSPIPLP